MTVELMKYAASYKKFYENLNRSMQKLFDLYKHNDLNNTILARIERFYSVQVLRSFGSRHSDPDRIFFILAYAFSPKNIFAKIART